MRKSMTDRGVAALKPSAARYAVPDPEMRGHWIRIQPSNAKSFWAVTRNPQGKQVWTLIGPADIGIEASRERARSVLQRVRDGLPAFEPRAESFGAVVANWLKRHVEGNGVRTAGKIKYLLDLHVLPVWRDREITSIRKGDIAALLDKVEDNHGGGTADCVLGVVRAVMNWFATRHDDYNPPIVRGMRRRKSEARERILDDNELRMVWQAAEGNGTLGAIVRMCLLTAQRSRKVASMKWSDLEDGTTWSIPKEPRAKETGGDLVLPDMARAIIQAQPHLASNPYVFAGLGGGPFRGFSFAKNALDAKLPSDMAQWQLHDLRRTARSLLSRAKVSSDHAERVMGHSVGGVEAIYDRHHYRDEKADALARLAALIDSIVHERSAAVLPLRRRNATPTATKIDR